MKWTCKRLGLPEPQRPAPIVAFIPLGRRRVDSKDKGFDLGTDNCIEEIFVKDGR